ncbi:MAG: DAK2 domain-containing protein [Clostridia bacterium]|nr:DAK2 domain-containing protein [Clostridia bacterium]
MDQIISGSTFRDMLLMGALCLEKNKQTIDSMNVFPVPDGDTGTNMSMTMQRAVQEIQSVDSDSVEALAQALATGALKGARGNSGVILSQIFRGFAKALKGVETGITAAMLASALTSGTEAAYKAVMKPKEGTMLTVARLISEHVSKVVASGCKNAATVVDVMLESGEAALKKTPELLPVLKEAGVLDSGGMGLLTIYRGFKLALDGEEPGEDFAALFAKKTEIEDTNRDIIAGETEDIVFGYCTEFFVVHLNKNATESEIEKFRDKLMKIGDSVVVVNDDDIIKVHVHSNDPGRVLQCAMRLGEIDRIKIENMREQNRAIKQQLKSSEKELGVVAVSAGDGIDEVLKSLGADVIIPGGQTMNPSVDVILSAVKKANARNVIVLPNNPNIIMAADSAAQTADVNVVVVPSRTIVQGITAMISFNPDSDVETNAEAMRESLESVLSGAVTFSVRDTSFEGKKIKENDIIGILEGKIETVSENVSEATEGIVDMMLEKCGSDGIVSLYFGSDTPEADAIELSERLQKKHPSAEFAVQYGGQPLYYYYIAVE